MTLTDKKLKSLIGAGAFTKIIHFLGGKHDVIKLRRVETVALFEKSVVPFHTDFSRRTMHVPLNDLFEGGDLVFATKDGFVVPRRPAGSAFIHTSQVVHGFTALENGTRYSLFLCATRGARGAQNKLPNLDYLVEWAK
jgi:predicted 2-oxoglutarate/Fe(II)-dependent dioxygenase YbiX